MSKSIFSVVAVLTVFALFSFSEVEKDTAQSEARVVETVGGLISVLDKGFEYRQTIFPDKFEYRERRETTKKGKEAIVEQSNVLDKY